MLQRLVLSSMRGAQGGPACGGVHLDTANTVANWSAHALLLLPQNGFYHWNPHHARYNDRVWISSTLEQQAQQAQQAQSCSPMAVEQGGSELQQQPQQQQYPEVAASQHFGTQSAAAVGSVLRPDHLRLVISPALAACLVGRAADSSSAGQPPEWPAAFEQARAEAHRGRWLKPASPHERAAHVAGDKRSTEDGTQTSVETVAEPAAPKTPEPAAPARATLAAPQRRRAVAWSIPADSESEQEEAWWCRATGIGSISSNSSGGVTLGSLREEAQSQEAQQRPQQQAQQQQQLAKCGQAKQAQQQEPREVVDAGEAWRRLTQCSVVVGMHPDQATGAGCGSGGSGQGSVLNECRWSLLITIALHSF